jgi:hypothetical protein
LWQLNGIPPIDQIKKACPMGLAGSTMSIAGRLCDYVRHLWSMQLF